MKASVEDVGRGSRVKGGDRLVIQVRAQVHAELNACHWGERDIWQEKTFAPLATHFLSLHSKLPPANNPLLSVLTNCLKLAATLSLESARECTGKLWCNSYRKESKIFTWVLVKISLALCCFVRAKTLSCWEAKQMSCQMFRSWRHSCGCVARREFKSQGHCVNIFDNPQSALKIKRKDPRIKSKKKYSAMLFELLMIQWLRRDVTISRQISRVLTKSNVKMLQNFQASS